MAMVKFGLTLGKLLALPFREFVDQLSKLPDPADRLRAVLRKVAAGRYPAKQGMWAVASVLAGCEMRESLLQPLSLLVQLIISDRESSSDPEVAGELRVALRQMEEKLLSRRFKVERTQRVGLSAEVDRARAELALHSGDLIEAEALLRDALDKYERLQHCLGAAVTALDLARVTREHRKDAKAAVEYLIQAADNARKQPRAADEDAIRVREAVIDALLIHARDMYYVADDPESTVRLTRRATELAPDAGAAWQLLGFAQSRLQNYEAAAQAYERLAELDPTEKTSARTNLGAALLQLGKEDGALAALEESLKLRPKEVSPLFMRGQLRERAGDLNGAVADLEATLDLIEADKPPENQEGAWATRHYREHWTMWLQSYDRLMSIHRRRGEFDALKAAIERLKHTGDDFLSAMGHRLAGDLARETGRLDEARREYDLALQSFEKDAEAREARGMLAAETGDVRAALEDFTLLASENAERAIDALKALAERFPHEPLILRWLGFAYRNLGDSENAEANLDAYLTGHPDDGEARRWLGLSLISAKEQQPQIDEQRCLRGLDELAGAAKQGDGEARTSLLWVIDRLMLDASFIDAHLVKACVILDVLPGLEDLIRRLEPARRGNRASEKRAIAFRKCIALAGQLGLPCYAAYLHALLSDLEFVRERTQAALDHLREAQSLMRLVGVPRSADLLLQYEEVKQEDVRSVGLELEHLHIYGKAHNAVELVENLSARLAASWGGTDRKLGNIASILTYVETISPMDALEIVQTLRDSDRLEDAFAVLDHVEKVRGGRLSKWKRGRLLLTRGTLFAAGGDLREAIEATIKAGRLLGAGGWIAALNVASCVLAGGLHTEALEVLDRIDIDRVARSDYDRFGYWELRASALEGCDRLQEAFDAARRAVDMLESHREGLKDLDMRSFWAAQRQTIDTYGLAVRIAAAISQPRDAFELTEKSRSRLFVDEMAIGRRIADEEGQQLERQVRQLEEKQDILRGVADGRPDPPQPDALRRLRELDPKLELLRVNNKGVEFIDKKDLDREQRRAEHLLEDLREKLGRFRIRTAKRLFGDVIGYEACCKLLADVGGCALIEMVVKEHDTLALLVRPGRDEPGMRPTLRGVDVEAWTRKFVQRTANPVVGTVAGEPDMSPIADLLALIEEETCPGEVICIVPHGPLHRLPFHALRLSSGYLLERNPVVYAPSASVLAQILRQHKTHAATAAIVAGDTRGDLPHAEREALAVADLLSVEPLAPRQATRRGLCALLRDAHDLRILHLACHGYFDPQDALSSGILMADDDAGRPAVLSARDLLQIEFHPDLVALSACDSGLSEITPGDEQMGLNRALLAGGARSVLSSLWRVNDLSTGLLMLDFYRGWLTGLSKADALRRAQIRLMKLTRRDVYDALNSGRAGRLRDGETAPMQQDPGGVGDLVYASPAYWAAFTLVGDWR
jgi:CHAT domain-containing protein/tetratricopeptide (TPR) repeat protein